jgi:hypothetical protein
MTTTPKTVNELLDYWPGSIPFKGKLVSSDGSCMCAQGQVLHFLDHVPAEGLRDYSQTKADKRVSQILGISRAHSILLRIVNDNWDGAPACVIRNPEQVLGDQSFVVLAFWRHFDRMTPAAWEAAWEAAWKAARTAAWKAAEAAARKAAWKAAEAAAREAAWKAAWTAAGEAAGEAAWTAAWTAAGEAAWKAARKAAWTAAWASNEIQGAAFMRANGQPFFFLPLFGFADPEAVIAADNELGRTA